MKKLLKILYGIVFIVVILIILVVALIHLFGNRAVKIGIETAATKTLNVGVSVEDVDLSIIGGKLRLQNLVIANPPGYQHDKLLELKSANIAVDMKSLLSDVVEIREIKLDGANVVLEQRGVSNNINDVIKAIPAKAEKPSEPSGKKLHIDKLEISNIKVKAKLLPVPGKVDTITLELDPIVMNDLGSDNKLDMARLSGIILMAVASGVANKGTGVLPKEITSTMKSTLDTTIKLGKTAAEEGKKLLKTGTDSGQEVIEGVKGLLKKPDKEKE